jgi:hypothetical protein
MDGKRVITGQELYRLYSRRFAYRRPIPWEHEQPHARRQWSSLAADLTGLFTEKLLANRPPPAALLIRLLLSERGPGRGTGAPELPPGAGGAPGGAPSPLQLARLKRLAFDEATAEDLEWNAHQGFTEDEIANQLAEILR